MNTSKYNFHVYCLQQRILGNDFYNKVCGHLKLLEKEYFGLEFRHQCGSYVSHSVEHILYCNSNVGLTKG